MYKLFVSELAHKDLDKIVSYISIELSNPMAVSSFLDELEKCYSHLKTSPYMYEKCLNKRLNSQGYRRALIKKYLLIYKIDDDLKIVNILRFFYGSQDYIKFI
jgi:plasmid stabilization system protein ParE